MSHWCVFFAYVACGTVGDRGSCCTCKTLDDPGEMLFCLMCNEHQHAGCIGLDVPLSQEKRASWQCSECQVCSVCRYVAGVPHSIFSIEMPNSCNPLSRITQILKRAAGMHLIPVILFSLSLALPSNAEAVHTSVGVLCIIVLLHNRS